MFEKGFSYVVISAKLIRNKLLELNSLTGIDNFESNQIKDWEYFSGDGNVEMDFRIKNGIAEINVDATKDIHNVWWALVKKNISSGIDLTLLEKEDYELRIEAKVKVSTAPRRVNLHVNTQIVQSDAVVISSKYVEENFNDWNNFSVGNEVGCLTLSSDQLIIFKWDFTQFNECKIEENGLLEISVDSYQTGKFSLEELGQIRLVEILGGNESMDWRNL
jgi:hypothetical protein